MMIRHQSPCTPPRHEADSPDDGRSEHQDSAATDWIAPQPSIADRMPTRFRSKGSTQGILVTTGKDPRQIFWESLGELAFLVIVLARLDIIDVREQQEALYRDDAGVLRRHFFDFVVTTRDGTRKAIAYKPSERVRALNFDAFLTDLAGRISPDFADEVVLITERDLPPATVHNAKLMHACRRDPPGDADEAVLAVLATITGRISIADLRAAAGHGGEGFRATVRLIGSGRIVMEGTGRITDHTLVRDARKETVQ
ncbi:hypothetical protein MKK50_13685 [Methylobacterium sp. J-043]|nr:hypothetical protein [Methylobacterium sp. J-043]